MQGNSKKTGSELFFSQDEIRKKIILTPFSDPVFPLKYALQAAFMPL